MRQCRVLVVDDDFAILDVVSLLLTEEGYRVVTARDGLEALDVLSSWRADVILLDMMLPRLSAPAFLARQRADPRIASIPVIAMSAGPRFQGGARLLPVAAALPKPFTIEELLTLVERLTAGVEPVA